MPFAPRFIILPANERVSRLIYIGPEPVDEVDAWRTTLLAWQIAAQYMETDGTILLDMQRQRVYGHCFRHLDHDCKGCTLWDCYSEHVIDFEMALSRTDKGAAAKRELDRLTQLFVKFTETLEG